MTVPTFRLANFWNKFFGAASMSRVLADTDAAIAPIRSRPMAFTAHDWSVGRAADGHFLRLAGIGIRPQYSSSAEAAVFHFAFVGQPINDDREVIPLECA